MIKNLFTAYALDLAPNGPLEGEGPLGNVGGTTEGAVTLFNRVVSNTVGVLTIFAGLWFIFQFLMGAFSYLTSGGDKAKTEAARGRISTALLGLVIVVAGIFIIDLIGTLLGLEILRPGQFILNLWQPSG